MELQAEEAREFKPVYVDEDVYTAVINDIDLKELEYGLTAILSFQITTQGPALGKVVDGLAKAHLNPKTKLWTWLTAMGFELEVGQKIDTENIKGKVCRIVVESQSKTGKDGKPFKQSQVVKVLPLQTQEPPTNTEDSGDTPEKVA